MSNTQPQKRILFVTTIWGTMRGFLNQHAEYLQMHGWEVHAATNLAGHDPSEPSPYKSVHHLPWTRSSRRIDLLATGARALRAVVRTTKPSIVHFHTPIASAVGRLALAPRRLDPAIAYTAHGFHFHPNGGYVQNSAAKFTERLLRPATSHIFTINSYDTIAATQLLGYQPRQVSQIEGIGIDLEEYRSTQVHVEAGDRLRRSRQIPADAPLIAFVGALNKNKRPWDVINAFRMLESSAHLVLAGDGPLRKELAAMGEPNVHILGRIEDVRPLVAAADVMVSASKREGLPRSLLEALAGSTPIITSRCRGSDELAAGATFDVGDTQALTALLQRYLWSAQDRDDLLKIQTRGLEKFGFSNVADQHLQVYNKLISR